MDVSAHPDDADTGAMDARGPRDQTLALESAARLVGHDPAYLKRRVETGALAVTTRDGRPVVAISELIRVGWLDSHGERWLLPETYGLPLSVPLDPEQMLTKRDVGELLGATSHTVSSWVERRHLQSIVVGGWPGPGNPKRRLIPVRELARVGLLTHDGVPTYVSPLDSGSARMPSRATARVPQRSIPDDLPTHLLDPRIGIKDPELAAVVLAGLSRFIASDRSRDGQGCYGGLCLLRRYAHTEVSRARVTHAAPCPDVDQGLPIPTGIAVTNNLGLPARHRQEEWARLLDADP